MKSFGGNKGCDFFGADKGYKKRGAKISMENLRGAKITVENLRGWKIFYCFPKNTPTGYPDLKKTGPLRPGNNMVIIK